VGAESEILVIAEAGETDTHTACRLFDALEAVELEELLGVWKGRELRTGHPLDGVMKKLKWYGKAFHDAENVDPLLFELPGGKIAAVDPAPVFEGMKLLKAQGGKARMRSIECRGKLSAAMVYDNLPIIDHFRKAGEGMLLGMMDRKGDRDPYFFLMEKTATVPEA
jgi:hypothetical protein